MGEDTAEHAQQTHKELLEKADRTIEQLGRRADAKAIDEAVALLKPLRDGRAFVRLGALAEAISRHRRRDPMVKRLLAQSLIERGLATVAIDVLTATLAGLDPSDDTGGERDELIGLIGRANKQIYMELPDTTTDEAADTLRASVEAYRGAYERNPVRNAWHGVNWCAVLHASRRRELRAAAEAVQRSLLDMPNSWRAADEWWNASLAETHIGLGNWADAQQAITAYVNDPRVTPFHLASTLRQFRDVWEIQQDGDLGAAIVQALEARLLRSGDSDESSVLSPGLALKPDYIRKTLQQDVPDELQRRLGDIGGVSIRWYRLGLERAASVAAIRLRHGSRIGSGFAVRAGDFGIQPADQLLLLTNYHVVNTENALNAARPDQVEVTFEAAGTGGEVVPAVPIAALLAQSPFDPDGHGLDYALLQLDQVPAAVKPVPIAKALPVLGDKPVVYVIGHPAGDELHITLQDNALLGHEGPPDGKPPRADCLRVHYRAPTEKGSSGSPVFDANWDTIALHHAGSKFDPPGEIGMPCLNGAPGRYSANEGYWIGSVIADVRARTIPPLSPL